MSLEQVTLPLNVTGADSSALADRKFRDWVDRDAGDVLFHSRDILEVGPGMRFHRIEEAVASARPGDIVRVHPQADNKPYMRTAVNVHTPGITIGGMRGPKGERIKLDGTGASFSGTAGVSRAIFQFDAGANGCTIDGFELCNAHNSSNNGAGIRVNAANNITIHDCEIDHNDDGVMSNGDVTKDTGANFRLNNCLIHHNGSTRDPGFSHNLYLGGTSVILHACEIHSSIGSGDNVKSRAHYTRIEYCFIHDSDNRELDLVDEIPNTTVANSDAVLIGNLIVKKQNGGQSHSCMHFGQDGHHEHNGTLLLIQNTVIAFIPGPIIELSAPGAHVVLEGNLIWAGGGRGGELLSCRMGAKAANLASANNWFSAGIQWPNAAPTGDNNNFGRGGVPPFNEFVNAGGRLTTARLADYFGRIVCAPLANVRIPSAPGEAAAFGKLSQYKNPRDTEVRRDAAKPCVGAFAAGN